MRPCNPGKCSGYLCRDICRDLAPGDTTLPRIGKRYGWIEVPAGNGAECENDRYQSSARCYGVGEKSHRDVAAAPLLTELPSRLKSENMAGSLPKGQHSATQTTQMERGRSVALQYAAIGPAILSCQSIFLHSLPFDKSSNGIVAVGSSLPWFSGRKCSSASVKACLRVTTSIIRTGTKGRALQTKLRRYKRSKAVRIPRSPDPYGFCTSKTDDFLRSSSAASRLAVGSRRIAGKNSSFFSASSNASRRVYPCGICVLCSPGPRPKRRYSASEINRHVQQGHASK
jgi:hypothetical protein